MFATEVLMISCVSPMYAFKSSIDLHIDDNRVGHRFVSNESCLRLLMTNHVGRMDVCNSSVVWEF